MIKRQFRDFEDFETYEVDGCRVQVKANGGNSFYVSTNQRGFPIKIRGVEYFGNCHLVIEDGEIHVGATYGVYLTKFNPRNYRDEPSDAAKRTFGEICVKAARLHLDRNPGCLRKAELTSINNDISRLNEQIAKLEEELSTLQVDRAALEMREEELRDKPVGMPRRM